MLNPGFQHSLAAKQPFPDRAASIEEENRRGGDDRPNSPRSRQADAADSSTRKGEIDEYYSQ
jgi:hypothetical protein